MYDDDYDSDFENDTVDCPNCREPIFEDAPQCPHCGHYVTFSRSTLAQYPGWLRGLLIAIVVLVILSLVLPSVLALW